MIQKKLQALSRLIHELTEVPLFNEMPTAEISSLNSAVTDEDSLRARVADICNLMDRLNKRDVDRFIGVTTKGSRECFIFLLKRLLPGDHNVIDNKIDYPLGMILLLRGFLTHRKNRNINKAFEFFEITNPIRDYKSTWEKIIFRFNEIIDQSIELLTFNDSKKDFKQVEIDEQLILVLEERLISRYRALLKQENIKKLLLYIMSEGAVIDRDLSNLFSLKISELRELLLPLVPNVLAVSYYDSEFTTIELKNYALEILKDLYFKRQV